VTEEKHSFFLRHHFAVSYTNTLGPGPVWFVVLRWGIQRSAGMAALSLGNHGSTNLFDRRRNVWCCYLLSSH